MHSETSIPQPALLFAEAEVRAERTVALLRILIAIALAAAFAIAVLPAAPSDEPVLARQLVFAGATMVAYFLLGVASFTAIALGLYRPWMAWLAVTGDCAFLLASIWFGLANTGLPAGYLISLPPIWLTPLVLAFGALRFNPYLQTYLLIALVTGLIWLAVNNEGLVQRMDSPPPPVLSFFFEPQPNTMRLVMVALAGVILVVASARARALLSRAISETRRRTNLTRYLPQQIADRLAEGGIDELRRGVRQDVAVLFVDIRGFTHQSEAMSPEALSAFVTEFRRRMVRAVDTCGGTIDKFIGDAAMVVFGLVPSSSNQAAAALACAGQILAEIAEWNRQRECTAEETVKVGVGAHWGEVFCGAIGDESRLEYTVLGDTVNVAARLEDLTKQVTWPIVVSQEILTAAGQLDDDKTWHPLEATALRGRRGLTLAYGSRGTAALA